MDVELISRYSSAVGEDHRKKYGQYFTESRVADFMVRWVLECRPLVIHDPAFGLGAFYDSALRLGFRGRFSAVDIDKSVLSFAPPGDRGEDQLQVRCEDYFMEWNQTHQAIVCNPPYMRFQKFLNRHAVFGEFASKLQVVLSGYTNIASAFLLKSLYELSVGGRLAYVMPLEFLNAGYGSTVKEELIKNGFLRAIVKVECEQDVFPDVTTSVGVILVEKVPSTDGVLFTVVNDIGELNNALDGLSGKHVELARLDPSRKWDHLFSDDRDHSTDHLVRLTEYGSFSRGIATGANEFFALRPSEIQTLGFDPSEYVSCITRSAHVQTTTFTDEDLTTLIDQDAQVYLINFPNELSDHARRYVEYGEEQRFSERYLTKCRSPWYRIENRRPMPIWFGVFSRDGFKIVRNYTMARALTCFHGFIPNLFGEQFVDHLFLFLHSRAGRILLTKNVRRYGGALNKFEPNDLNQSLCPSVECFSSLAAERVAEEIRFLRENGKLSKELDQFFDLLLMYETSEAENNIESLGQVSKTE